MIRTEPLPTRAPNPGRLVGRTYYERGRPVTVVVQWATGRRAAPSPPLWLVWAKPPGRAPRNVAVRRDDGTVTVRPFRGLRRTAPAAAR